MLSLSKEDMLSLSNDLCGIIGFWDDNILIDCQSAFKGVFFTLP